MAILAPRPIKLKKKGDGVYLEGDWPWVALLQKEIIEKSKFVSIEGDIIRIDLANGWAVYRKSIDNGDGTIVATLSGTDECAPATK
jgi:hypothetical protein